MMGRKSYLEFDEVGGPKPNRLITSSPEIDIIHEPWISQVIQVLSLIC